MKRRMRAVRGEERVKLRMAVSRRKKVMAGKSRRIRMRLRLGKKNRRGSRKRGSQILLLF